MTVQALLPDLLALILGAALTLAALVPLVAAIRRRHRQRRHDDRLAVLAHELRTPLDALGGLLELQYRQQTNRQQDTELARQAVICVRELTLLLDSLLSWVAGARRPPALRAVRLDALLDEVAQLFVLQAAQKGLYLEAAVAAGVDAPLLLDVSRLRQVLVNLVSNAVRHSDGGTIRLSGRSSPAGGDRVTVEIVVEDNGAGFSRAAAPGWQGGSGLGLGICRELCAALGATLDVDSAPERGTRFRVRLDARLAAAEPAPGAGRAGCAGTGFDAAHVLLVDDNPSTRILLERQLTLLALDVTSCTDGSAALRQWRRQPFDLILCDRYMPRMDGLQFARRVRRMERRYRLERTPIIGLSAAGESGFDGADVEVSAPRPATLSALQALIRPYLREAEAPTRLQLSALKQLTDDDPVFEAEFLESIRQCNRQDIARALRAYREHNLDELANPVHRLTGMARLICQPAIGARGGEVEKAICRGDAERVAQLLPQWLSDMQGLERELERRLSWIATRGAPAAPDAQTSRS